MEYNSIEDNIRAVRENISDCCLKCNRNLESVTLIAVSKTKPVSMLMEAYHTGCRDFGENKVQELMDKQEEMPKDIHWHFIGHLQTNKVKYLIGKVFLIHSVDSLHLAQVISKEAEKQNVIMNILIEVNIAEEKTKFGSTSKEVTSLIKEISLLPNIKIRGLMTIAPYVENPEQNRQYFVKLQELSVDIANENIDNVCMDILSMGMSGDYCVAIESGATYVRVGSKIFGERNYSL